MESARQDPNRDALRAQALGHLCAVKALAECKDHPGVFFAGDGTLADACRLAAIQVDQGEVRLPDGMSPGDYIAVIEDVHAEHSSLDRCPRCEKNFGDD